MRLFFSAFVVGTIAILDIFASTIRTTEAALMKMSKKNNHGLQQHETTPTTEPRYLVAQPGHVCSIMAQPANIGSYTLRATVSTNTVGFSEHPTRKAKTHSTEEFVDGFPGLFETSKPNGAITFVSDDTASAVSALYNKPLIVVLSEPDIGDPNLDGTWDIEYTLTQSPSQSGVISIEQFLDNTFRSCSIFIDGSSLGW